MTPQVLLTKQPDGEDYLTVQSGEFEGTNFQYKNIEVKDDLLTFELWLEESNPFDAEQYERFEQLAKDILQDAVERAASAYNDNEG